MLDNYSLMLMCGFVSIMCSLLWFAHAMAFPNKNKPGLILGLFCFLVALGFVLYTFRKEGNYLIGWYASDIFFFFGLLCAQLGVKRFFSESDNKQLYICIFLILIQIIYRINENTYSAALLLSSYMVYCVLCTVIVIKNNTSKADKKIFIFTLAPLCVSAVLMSTRVVSLILKPDLHTVDITNPSQFNTLVIFSFMVSLIGLNSSYLTVSLGSIISKGEKLSYQDPLTKLSNRKKLKASEVYLLKIFAVGLFKIDQLKEINQKNGFEQGDVLLKNFGKWAQDYISKDKDILGNTLYRMDGNRVLIIFKTDNPQKIAAWFNEFSTKFSQNFDNCTLTAGFSITSVTQSSFEDLYEKASTALSQAKKVGKGRTALSL